MPHQDKKNLRINIANLKEIFKPLLPDSNEIPIRHGNAQLDPRWLAVTAIVCWGWTFGGTLADRFSKACETANSVLGTNVSATRQGIQKALRAIGNDFFPRITNCFVATTPGLKGHWSSNGKVNFAVDGTKFSAPRTKQNQDHFSAIATRKNPKDYVKKSDKSKASGVQILATVLWHINTGLPYCWSIKKSSGSEKKSLVAMLDQLPQNARIVGDANFIGYPLWSSIIDSKRTFLFRIGANVRLLKNLGHLKFKDGYVYYWPELAMKNSQPPLVLRLIKIPTGKRNQMVYLVTNELDMTDEIASELYRSRWGIEIFFRSVKQSCMHCKMSCRTPVNVEVELGWTLLGIWAALFAGKKILKSEGTPISKLSPVQTVRALSYCVDVIWQHAREVQILFSVLSTAVIAEESGRKTSKQSRNYPRKQKYKPPGNPTIQPATPYQKQQAKKQIE